MSTVAYVVSVLASLVLIGASAVPVVHRWFTGDRGRGAVMTLSLSSSGECAREFLTGVEDGEAAPGALRDPGGQELDGRRVRIEVASPSGQGRSDIRGAVRETALVPREEGHPCR